ncbi:MAG: hypothetical protein IT560_12405 [Alphaproteobacteria bacterium]|nr:hypothetical protein [Alphaproteobacteria bacterium]
MDRFIRYAAYLLNAGLIVFILAVIFNTYNSRDKMLAFATLLVPVISLCALKSGPDSEERQLQREVNKARLRAELAKLSGK